MAINGCGGDIITAGLLFTPIFPSQLTQCRAVCVKRRSVYFCSAWKIECEQIGRSRQRSRQRQTARLSRSPEAKMLFIHARAACESFAHLRAALSPLAGVFNLSVPRARLVLDFYAKSCNIAFGRSALLANVDSC